MLLKVQPVRPRPRAVIFIRERNFNMMKKDLILRNPLRLMGYPTDDILNPGQFGAVLARAGVGKTAFLVQLSLNCMLREKNVLHISIGDPVNKVGLWYKEVYSRIAAQYRVHQMEALFDSLLPRRFIMTFRAETFSVPILEERLTDLTAQDIFSPRMMLVDGLPFDVSVREPLLQLKSLAKDHGMHAWFTVRTHRHEKTGDNDMPLQIDALADLFEVAVQLVPMDKQVRVKTLKGDQPADAYTELVLDPATMLITDQG